MSELIEERLRPTASLSMPQWGTRPRVGHIEFLNCLPLFWGLARSGSLGDLDVRRGTPEILARGLIEGQLDAGPVTLFEALRHPDELLVLPDISIASTGEVKSCVIFSRVPLSELDGCDVALASTSRTSVALAKLLLRERYGVEPNYVSTPPDIDVMLDTAPAGVLIGDPALRLVLVEAEKRGLVVHDLAAMWREWTGLPFVFAIFAMRRAFAERAPEEARRVHAQLRTSMQLGLLEVAQVSSQAERWEGFTADELRDYFSCCLNFELSDDHRHAIRQFSQLARSLDPLVRPFERLTFFQP